MLAATGRDVGMGGLYDVGPQRIAWAQNMLTNWIGDHGFLHKLFVSVRAPNHEGNTVWWHGTVVDKVLRGGHAVVVLRVEAMDQLEESSAVGTATVVLPSREHGPVRLPVDPSEP